MLFYIVYFFVFRCNFFLFIFILIIDLLFGVYLNRNDLLMRNYLKVKYL